MWTSAALCLSNHLYPYFVYASSKDNTISIIFIIWHDPLIQTQNIEIAQRLARSQGPVPLKFQVYIGNVCFYKIDVGLSWFDCSVRFPALLLLERIVARLNASVTQ